MTTESDVREHNRRAWDLRVKRGNRWTVPVTSDEIERARRGDWDILLTPGPVPRDWFGNPIMCVFDDDQLDRGILEVRYPVPYSDITSISDSERAEIVETGEPLVFGHSLDDQLGGQLAAGFVITGFSESGRGPDQLPDRYIPPYIATRALKPSS